MAAHSVDADDWDRHWDDFSAANSSNPAQDYRRLLCLQLLERRGMPKHVLDIGSGQGDFLVAAQDRWPTARLAGIEYSEMGVRKTRERVPAAESAVRDLLDGTHAPEPMRGWATHAICSEVLEHVDDDVALLAAAREYLAPGCRLVVTVPGGNMSAFDRHIGHRRHYTPERLRETLQSAGLHVASSVGAGFPFFNVYRALIIARGERLVDDAQGGSDGNPTGLVAAGMKVFDLLFRMNLPRSPWGVQIVAVAYEPG
jgi:trans-aconitate methyltransferase